MRFTFNFRWVPFIATLIVVLVGISLGEWQRGRANEKLSTEALLKQRQAAGPLALAGDVSSADIASFEYRRVSATGKFLSAWTVYLDNRPHNGTAGFYLLTPLLLSDREHAVLVLRGWVPRDPVDRSRIPAVPTPVGEIKVEGIVRKGPGHVMQLGDAPPVRPRAILQNVDLKEFARASGLQLLPFIIEQSADASDGNSLDNGKNDNNGKRGGDGLIRDWPRPASDVSKHIGYAFQWYALAATAFIFFLVTGFRRGTNQAARGE